MRHINKISRLIWFGLIIFAAGQLYALAKAGFPVDTDIMDLFPATEQDPVVEHSIKSFGENVGQKLVFLIGHQDKDKAMLAADAFYDRIVASNAFSQIHYRVDEEKQNRYFQQLLDYRYYLLSENDRLLLMSDNTDAILENASRAMYNPVNFTYSTFLEMDPLFLLQHFLDSLPSAKADFLLDDQRLLLNHGGSTYYFISAYLKDSPFSIDEQEKVIAVMEGAKRDLLAHFPEIEMLSSGVVRHAAAGTQSAVREISTIGAGSVVGILLLILITFRSMMPLLYCLIPVLSGVMVALVACVQIFGSVHLFTLVFGASLIGISVDYSLHYLSDRLMGGADWRAEQALKRIAPGITLGLITTTIGYAGLSIAPFPGLRQIAVFSGVGLLTAYLTVILIFPLMIRSHHVNSGGRLKHHLEQWLLRIGRLRRRKIIYPAIAVILVFNVFGISLVQPNDDISALQDISEVLRREDMKVAEIIGGVEGNQFFLVEGDSLQAVLEHEERLTGRLNELIKHGELGSYRALSTILPSFKRQEENLGLLRKRLLNEREVLRTYMAEIGYSDKSISKNLHDLGQYRQALLEYSDLAENALMESVGFLFLGESERGYASIVTVAGLTGPEMGMAIESDLNNIAFINKVADISELFQRYRVISAILVVISYALIYCMLLLRYRFLRATLIIMPPVVAALTTVSVIGYLGEPFSLFNALALLLVLGIGIDYALFFAESREENTVSTMLAVILSALTTIMSFGFLSFSETQAIHAFGLTVFLGVGFAFLLSLLTGREMCRDKAVDGSPWVTTS